MGSGGGLGGTPVCGPRLPRGCAPAAVPPWGRCVGRWGEHCAADTRLGENPRVWRARWMGQNPFGGAEPPSGTSRPLCGGAPREADTPYGTVAPCWAPAHLWVMLGLVNWAGLDKVRQGWSGTLEFKICKERVRKLCIPVRITPSETCSEELRLQRVNTILPSMPRSPKWSLPFRFSN
jgi:hypothetical protein